MVMARRVNSSGVPECSAIECREPRLMVFLGA